MKSSIFKIALCIFSLAVVACGGKSDTVRDSARDSLGGATTTTPGSNSTLTAPGSTASIAGGVQHYTCPKNCAGSGGSAAGTCPVCGSEYLHNQAFHAQSATTPTTPTMTMPGAAPGGVTPPPPTTPEPAQNAAGVWHYTCAKGCAGGAGSAGTCATCGGALAHNTAYHQ